MQFLSESAIWDELHTTREFLLSNLSDPLKRDLAFVAYSDQKPIGFGRVTASLQSIFAGLWAEAFLRNFADAEFIGRFYQHGFNMPGNSIRFATYVSMRCLPAVRSWRNTDSSEWHQPGLRTGLQTELRCVFPSYETLITRPLHQ